MDAYRAVVREYAIGNGYTHTQSCVYAVAYVVAHHRVLDGDGAVRRTRIDAAGGHIGNLAVFDRQFGALQEIDALRSTLAVDRESAQHDLDVAASDGDPVTSRE